MKRTIVQFIIKFMEEIGINISKERRTTNVGKKIIVTMLTLLTFYAMFMYIIKNRHEFHNIAFGICYIIADFSVVTTHLNFIFTTDRVRSILTDIDNNIFTYSDEDKITPSYSWILKEKNMMLFFMIALCNLIFTLCLMTIPTLLKYFITGQLETEIYPGWIPVENNVINFLFQLSTILASAYIVYFKQIFFLFIHFEFERQCKRLRSSIATIEGRSLTDTLERIKKQVTSESNKGNINIVLPSNVCELYKIPEFATTYEKILQKNLIQCIQHHRKLIQYVIIFF